MGDQDTKYSFEKKVVFPSVESASTDHRNENYSTLSGLYPAAGWMSDCENVEAKGQDKGAVAPMIRCDFELSSSDDGEISQIAGDSFAGPKASGIGKNCNDDNKGDWKKEKDRRSRRTTPSKRNAECANITSSKENTGRLESSNPFSVLSDMQTKEKSNISAEMRGEKKKRNNRKTSRSTSRADVDGKAVPMRKTIVTFDCERRSRPYKSATPIMTKEPENLAEKRKGKNRKNRRSRKTKPSTCGEQAVNEVSSVRQKTVTNASCGHDSAIQIIRKKVFLIIFGIPMICAVVLPAETSVPRFLDDSNQVQSYPVLTTPLCSSMTWMKRSECPVDENHRNILIGACGFAAQCHPGTVPFCVDTDNGMRFICTANDLPCPAGFKGQIWVDEKFQEHVRIQIQNCLQTIFKLRPESAKKTSADSGGMRNVHVPTTAVTDLWNSRVNAEEGLEVDGTEIKYSVDLFDTNRSIVVVAVLASLIVVLSLLVIAVKTL